MPERAACHREIPAEVHPREHTSRGAGSVREFGAARDGIGIRMPGEGVQHPLDPLATGDAVRVEAKDDVAGRTVVPPRTGRGDAGRGARHHLSTGRARDESAGIA